MGRVYLLCRGLISGHIPLTVFSVAQDNCTLPMEVPDCDKGLLTPFEGSLSNALSGWPLVSSSWGMSVPYTLEPLGSQCHENQIGGQQFMISSVGSATSKPPQSHNSAT